MGFSQIVDGMDFQSLYHVTWKFSGHMAWYMELFQPAGSLYKTVILVFTDYYN